MGSSGGNVVLTAFHCFTNSINTFWTFWPKNVSLSFNINWILSVMNQMLNKSEIRTIAKRMKVDLFWKRLQRRTTQRFWQFFVLHLLPLHVSYPNPLFLHIKHQTFTHIRKRTKNENNKRLSVCSIFLIEVDWDWSNFNEIDWSLIKGWL
jgi:hypothetical protein